MTHAPKVDLTVMLDDKHAKDIDKVAKSLQKAGLQIQEVLREIGAVTGSALTSSLAKIEGVKGVSAIEKSRTVQLPPPESDVL